MSRALLFALGCAAIGTLGCARAERKPDRTEPWPATSLAASASAAAQGPVEYTLAKSTIEFELPARRSTPRGRVRSARGQLTLDFAEPSRSRGHVVADLLSLELADPASDADGTAQALGWLELGAEVAEDLRETGRHATFELRSLTAAPSPRAAGRAGSNQSDWMLEGQLSLHGVRAPKTAEIRVEPGAAEGAEPPLELVIRSRKPLVIALSTHDIRPRDQRGSARPAETSRRDDTRASEARVTFELSFVRTPTR